MIIIAIDVVLVLIVAYCAWRGFRNGIIRGICGILAIIVALYGANLVATVYSSEFTGMLRPFVSGIVDSSVSKVLSGGEEEPEAMAVARIDGDEETEERTIMILSDKEKEDVYTVCFAAMRYLGLSEKAADKIAASTAEVTSNVGQQMSADLTTKLCETMAFVATFAICFILLAIIFAVIGNVIDLTFAIPGIEKVEPFIGIVFGIARGILVILVIGMFFRYAGILLPEGTIESTKIFSRLVSADLVAGYIGL